MTPAPLRKDAARNWQRIVDAGRQLVDDGTPLQLNDVARSVGVGVATVYRHFPTPEALLEAVATPGLQALAAHAERALTEADSWQALEGLLRALTDTQMTDAALSPVFAAAEHALPDTTALRDRILAVSGDVLDRAQVAGTARADVKRADLIPLMCGVAYAATAHADGQESSRDTAHRYLGLLLDGIRR